MKKITIFLLIIILFSYPLEVYALDERDIKFDTSESSKGYLTISIEDELYNPIIIVEKDLQYIYRVDSVQDISIPLQMGAGVYTIKILESIKYGKPNLYRIIKVINFEVKQMDELELYTISNPVIDISTGGKTIEQFNIILEGLSEYEKIETVYHYVISHITYDYYKAKNLTSNYIPKIDSINESKKGICFDYSVYFAAILRSQNIPTKLVLGYTNDNVYHAWNEVCINGQWETIDTTYDASFYQNGFDTKMFKDNSQIQLKPQKYY